MGHILYKEHNGVTTVPGMFCFASDEEATKFCRQFPGFTEDTKGVSLGLVMDTMTEAMQQGEELRPAPIKIKTQDTGPAKVLWPFKITPAVLGAVQEAVTEGATWAAYNTSFRHLDVEDIFFTDSQMEAVWYADFKTNEIDHYSFRQFESVEDFVYKITCTKEPDLFITQKTNSMNKENVDFLHNQIKYAGFGEELHGALVKQITNDPGEFKLAFEHTFGKDKVEAELNFKRSKESDMYFFNSYDMTVKRDGKPDISNTFYINQGQSITMKEAYNLLSGRSVEKELLRKLTDPEKAQYKAEMKLEDKSKRFLPENWEKPPHYVAWVKLDMNHRDKNGNFEMRQYHENFGFKLEDALAKLPLRKMTGSEKTDLMESLTKGNLTQATFSVDGVDKKFMLAVDPQFKAIQVHNMDGSLAKKETFSQNTKKEEGQTNTVAQQPGAKDLVAGPEAPWEGKKTEVAQAPGEEKKN